MKKILFLVCLLAVPQVWSQTAPSAAGKVFGWKVKSPSATAYLVGSIHLAKPDLYPLDPKLEAAFGSSSALVVEFDATREAEALAALMLQKATYPTGDTITKHVSQETLQKADLQLQKSGLGVPMFAQFKAWFLAQTIQVMELQRLGFSPEHGIDLYFLNKAKGQKKILELESPDSQIAMLNSFTDKEQEQFLLYTLNDIGNTEKNLKEILSCWKEGDPDRLEKFLTQSVKDTPELQSVYRKLIEDRNVTMAKHVDGYLKTQDTYFIVVGSAHLIGETGLLNLLKKAGYSVEPL
jgi:uncharacterized protein